VSDARRTRLETLRASLLEMQVDGMLVTSLANVRYLTGFSGSNALLLISMASPPLLVTDFRYATQVADEVGSAADVVIASQSTWAAFWEQARAQTGLSVLAFESAHLLHRDFERLLQEGARWTWRPTREVVEALRERKDPGELALIQVAAEIAEAALAAALPQVRVGMTELAVAGILEHELRRAGSEGFPFPSIVASGERAALPHARSSTRMLQRDEFLLLDFGAVHAGYCSDISRTVVIGRADALQREVYGAVAAAQDAACREVRHGLSGREADAIARTRLDAAGFGAEFGHSLGHGIGLEVHEGPRLAQSAEAILPLDAVVTVEPGVYRAGWGGVRIEDDVHLAAQGPRRLTTFTRELLELG
jgi:Xaa-Pro aminopeptidase